MILALGWLAAALYVLAHAQLIVTGGKQRKRYFQLNLLGAALFVVSSAAMHSWQSVIVNLFWLLTSLLALGQREHLLTRNAGQIALACFAVGAGMLLLFGAYRNAWVPALGWIGVALYCSAYFALAERAISRRLFLQMNTIAPLLLIAVYDRQGNWPAVGVSVLWAALSAIGSLRAALQEQR